MEELYSELLAPGRVWSRREILDGSAPIPRLPGVYAWYFRSAPPQVPTLGCVKSGGLTLLYVGISPKAPLGNGRTPSRQTLRERIRYHMRGNAEGSTLRLSLGCLLAAELGIQLRRVGSGNRTTFSAGEEILSEWLGRNAFVSWLATGRPWEIEEELIFSISLPLNLAGNELHPFYTVLARARREAKAVARELPVLPR